MNQVNWRPFIGSTTGERRPHRPGDAGSESGIRWATTTNQTIHATVRASASTITIVCVWENPSVRAAQSCTRSRHAALRYELSCWPARDSQRDCTLTIDGE